MRKSNKDESVDDGIIAHGGSNVFREDGEAIDNVEGKAFVVDEALRGEL